MPVNPTVRSLAQDGRFTLNDAEKLKSAVTAGTVSQAEAKDVLSRYAEVMDADAQSAISDAFQAAPRAKLQSFAEGFTDKTLKRGDHSDDVGTLQRGLMSAGRQSNNPDMTLAAGADGIFGAQTQKAVKAFQKANGIAETGIADPVTLKALQQAMAGSTPTASRPTTAPVQPQQAVRPSTGLRRPEAAATPAPAAGAPTTTAPTVTAAGVAAGAVAGAARPSTTPTAPARPATPTPTQAAPTPTPTQTPPKPETRPASAPTTPTPPATTAKPTSPTVVPLSEGVKPGTPQAVIDAGNTLATGPRAENYGTVNPWRNVDPNHAAPVDVRIGGLKDRWKCNLFGGNTLAAAGFEPPYYGNKGKGEYAVAEDWNKWSTPTPEAKARAAAEGHPIPNYAATSRNQSRFDLQDEVRPPALGCSDEEKRARVQQFLDRVQPGDVVTVDHPGASGSDGGHVRVCVGRDPVTNQPMFAQAKQDSAHVVTEGPDSFMREDAMFILRPNTPRAAR